MAEYGMIFCFHRQFEQLTQRIPLKSNKTAFKHETGINQVGHDKALPLIYTKYSFLTHADVYNPLFFSG
ncbi:MAG: hypothetical protein JWQ25_2743 [Daejeonella sp.]|nr:hypothetical protein [Daejeonella sp.]